jgi:hypothetical protein
MEVFTSSAVGEALRVLHLAESRVKDGGPLDVGFLLSVCQRFLHAAHDFTNALRNEFECKKPESRPRYTVEEVKDMICCLVDQFSVDLLGLPSSQERLSCKSNFFSIGDDSIELVLRFLYCGEKRRLVTDCSVFKKRVD